MDLSYPQTGFHFSVIFELFPQFPNDIRFQEVSGLSAEVETESFSEGGENRLVHQLPVRTKYNDLTLKRGKFLGSGILHWCRKAIEKQEYSPTNLMISLLDENHLPIYNWYVVHALPKRLEIGAFNAERNEVVIETMVLQYHYFKYYDPASVAMDLAGSLTASANINIGF
ncbi:phage tail protein [Spirosoma pollinicola]|uniref:Glycerol acyltransferase n=1 Tax=Spirosoma pollinicola TaxID=2057025 RepID=A0A2K8Z4V3_9BACT|nr:phage tail protein [Spirosoma pollinicola]AUD04890.1 glycerol acyltransferase [Spirosoma pollinicola]